MSITNLRLQRQRKVKKDTVVEKNASSMIYTIRGFRQCRHTWAQEL